LALFWPAEIAGATAAGLADPALVNHLESRGFSATSSGRLALRARSQSQLGLPMPADDLPVSASYVSFVRRDAPPQAGTGSLVWVPPTPQMGDQRWVLNLTLPLRGLIGPKPATWLEELFWGRRNTLALSWGDGGSRRSNPASPRTTTWCGCAGCRTRSIAVSPPPSAAPSSTARRTAGRSAG